jgi:hypothetical protein
MTEKGAPLGRHTNHAGNDPKDLRPPIKYKLRRVARELSKAEIEAAADRAEARAKLTTTRLSADQPNSSASTLRVVAGRPAATRVIEG